jgi:hypothetical protein
MKEFGFLPKTATPFCRGFLEHYQKLQPRGLFKYPA